MVVKVVKTGRKVVNQGQGWHAVRRACWPPPCALACAQERAQRGADGANACKVCALLFAL